MHTFKRVVFVLSTGRTGTVSIANNINSFCSEVYAVHEPKPSRWLQVLGNRYLCGRASRDQLVFAYRKSRNKIFRNAEKTSTYIEANPFLYGFIDVLDDLFKKPLILHIVRDPRSYIVSHTNHGALTGFKGLMATFNTSWMLRPDEFELQPERLWREMSNIEKLAWRWNAINQQLGKGEELFGERYRRVKFEDLLNKSGDGIRDFASWVGIQNPDGLIELFNRGKLNKSFKQNCPKWDDWSEENQLSMSLHCAPLMKKYGYKLPDEPVPKMLDVNLDEDTS